MQAVQYDFSIPRYLAVKAAGGLTPSVYTNPVTSPLALRDVPPPSLPGPDWLAIEPILAGICGTDLGTITGKTSPALAPFASFPATLGHEVVGRVVEVGEGAKEFAVGERVVVDPWISCTVRGLEPCRPCREGRPYICRRAAEGPFGAGMLIGFCRGLHGGWSERMMIHKTQAYRVPSELCDEAAVLVEPVSVALHGVLQGLAGAPERDVAGARVLVIGAGTIGLCTVAAIRLLGLDWHVTVLARHGAQRQLAADFGADAVLPSGKDAAVRAAQAATGARRYEPPIGPPVLTGGFDWVFDCVGTQSSVDGALRAARERGRVVLLGGAGELSKVDWTFVWLRELVVIGSCGYGLEPAYGRHTYEVLFSLLARGQGVPLERMITHRFRLAAYREAIRCNLERSKTGAVKTVFEVG